MFLKTEKEGRGEVCGVQEIQLSSYEDSTYDSVNHNSVGNSHFGSLSIWKLFGIIKVMDVKGGGEGWVIGSVG